MKITIPGASELVFFVWYCQGYKMKKCKMNSTCSTHGGNT